MYLRASCSVSRTAAEEGRKEEEEGVEEVVNKRRQGYMASQSIKDSFLIPHTLEHHNLCSVLILNMLHVLHPREQHLITPHTCPPPPPFPCVVVCRPFKTFEKTETIPPRSHCFHPDADTHCSNPKCMHVATKRLSNTSVYVPTSPEQNGWVRVLFGYYSLCTHTLQKSSLMME